MTSRRPNLYRTDEQTNEGRAPLQPSNARLPQHVASIRLPSGKTLGDLNGSELARICSIAQIPGAGHDQGRQKNAELLTSTLEAIGRQASEQAIAAWLKQTLGDAA